jgi:hypothetical protein
MLPLVESAIPVRFVAGDIDSKRDAFLVMFRLVIGNALATGRHLKDIAEDIDVSICKLADWIAGEVGDHEVEDMSRKCVAFAHGLGLDLEAVES